MGEVSTLSNINVYGYMPEMKNLQLWILEKNPDKHAGATFTNMV